MTVWHSKAAYVDILLEFGKSYTLPDVSKSFLFDWGQNTQIVIRYILEGSTLGQDLVTQILLQKERAIHVKILGLGGMRHPSHPSHFFTTDIF